MMAINKSDLTSWLRATTRKVTSSKLALFYLSFSLLYCVIQTALSARVFIDASGAVRTLKSIADLGNALRPTIPIWDGTSLALCSSERDETDYICNVVWDGSVTTSIGSAPILSRAVTSITFGSVDLELDDRCLLSLNLPIFELSHAKREAVAFLCFQVWVFFMSLIAVTNESIPHIFASLLTHILALGWSCFQIAHSMAFANQYNEVITNGACRGVSILPDLFDIRKRTDIPIAVVNGVALVFSAFLTMRLIKLLNWRHFKITGADLRMNKHRTIMLVLFINLQLSLFFVVIFESLLLDLLVKGTLSNSTSFPTLYKACQIVSIIVAAPWIAAGWYSVQRELRRWMFVFLSWALIWLAGFGTMFFSTSLLQEFTRWPFLATMGAAAVISTTCSFVLGIICRFNFGKGYLATPKPNALGHAAPLDEKPPLLDVEKGPHEAIAFPDLRTAQELPQLTFSPPRLPLPPRAQPRNPIAVVPDLAATSSTSSSMHSSRLNAPPSHRDSASSFGNVKGLGSIGHLTPQRAPTAVSSSSGSSMYTSSGTGGLTYQDSWSSFGNTNMNHSP